MKNLVKVVGAMVVTGLVAVTVKKVVDKNNQKKESNDLLCKEVDWEIEKGEAIGTVMTNFPYKWKSCDIAKIYKVADDYVTLYKRTYKNQNCIAENLPDKFDYDRKEFLATIKKAENYEEIIKTIERYQGYIIFANSKVDGIIG